MRDGWPYEELQKAGVAVLDCEHKTPRDAGTGHPYIAIPNIVDGRIYLSGVRRVTREDFIEWTRRTKPQSGDVVVTRRGRVGDTAPIPSGLECAIGQNLVILRSNGYSVAQRFLRWATRGEAWMSEVHRLLNVGAVFSSLNVRDISRLRIFTPPLAEQQAISGILDALDSKITVNERVTATASELAVAHYLAAPERDLVKITDVAQVTMGQSPPGDTFNEQGIGLPFYQGTRDFGFRFPGRRVWCTAVTRQAKANDVLVSVRAPVGQINVAAELCGIGRGLASVRSEEYPHVLLQALSADRSIWNPYAAEGTIFGSITKKQFTQLEIGWPKPEFIDSLELRLKVLDQRIRQAAAESRTLAALRDTLLPQLMSGKLRVREAEKIVEDAV
ncbi:restriction endonuclease subunit S [Streptomyces sp. NPDC006990]|uniref:restriction endonuclease subunit S n=1 Tax=Streptomyces sp. NPDC006990 TaxID=3154481 RepID=UPI0034514C2D